MDTVNAITTANLRCTIWAIVAVLIICIILRRFQLASRIVDIILRQQNPIHHVSSHQPLPSVPFQLPNGQGNVEKFLNGHQNSLEWGLKYGSVYRIWSGFQSEIVVSDPTDIETIFRDSHNHQKAPANNSGNLMHLLLGSCVGLISGQEWRSVRRATEHSFLRPNAKSQVYRIMSRAKTCVSSLYERQIKKKAENKAEEGIHKQIDLHPVVDLKHYPFLVVAEILYGKLSPELEQRLVDSIPPRTRIFDHVIQGGITRFRVSRFLPLQVNRDLDMFKKQWGAWNDDAHAAAAAALRGDNSDTSKLRPAILDMYQSIEKGLTTREHLLQTLDEMLFANLDVTMGALSWPLIFLAAHPTIQKALHHEIITYSSPENLDSYMLSTTTYLHSLILESARLRPLASFSIPQSCPTPRVVGDGYLVPAGTNFIIDTYALNIRSSIWGPDNASFRPERWSETQGDARKSKDLRYCYWRFGFGPRLCLGKYVADVMVKAVIVELVKGFELGLGTNGEWKWDQESWIHHPAMQISCVKRRM